MKNNKSNLNPLMGKIIFFAILFFLVLLTSAQNLNRRVTRVNIYHVGAFISVPPSQCKCRYNEYWAKSNSNYTISITEINIINDFKEHFFIDHVLFERESDLLFICNAVVEFIRDEQVITSFCISYTGEYTMNTFNNIYIAQPQMINFLKSFFYPKYVFFSHDISSPKNNVPSETD